MAEIEKYVELDRQADGAEQNAIRARWQFGKLMLVERNGKAKLPKGRIAELCKATGKSKTEISYRAQFAEKYPTEPELSNALDNFPSWHAVVEHLSGKWKPAQPLQKSPFPPMSRHRHAALQSTLQKAIRRDPRIAEIDALRAAFELDARSGPEFVKSRASGKGMWTILFRSASEDHGPADTGAILEVLCLYLAWLKAIESGNQPNEPWRLHTVDAVMRLCRAPKSRVVDNACTVLNGRAEKMAQELRDNPDAARNFLEYAGDLMPNPEEVVKTSNEAARSVEEVRGEFAQGTRAPIPPYASDGMHAGKKQPGALAVFVVREDAALSPKADVEDPYGKKIRDTVANAIRD